MRGTALWSAVAKDRPARPIGGYMRAVVSRTLALTAAENGDLSTIGCAARQERPGGAARFPVVAFVFFITLPGLIIGLVALTALDRAGRWISGRSGLPWYRDGRRPAPAPGLDELHALFYASKRPAIEQRRLELVLRDDQHDGAPPRIRIDLDAGRAVISSPARPSASGT
jgi:hypothetical protein